MLTEKDKREIAEAMNHDAEEQRNERDYPSLASFKGCIQPEPGKSAEQMLEDERRGQWPDDRINEAVTILKKVQSWTRSPSVFPNVTFIEIHNAIGKAIETLTK